METDADRALESAQDAIQTSIEQLSKILTGEVDGADEYTEQYQMQIEKAFEELLTTRRRLRRV